MGKAFEKQKKTIEDQGKNQVDNLKNLKPKELEATEDKSNDNEKHLKYKLISIIQVVILKISNTAPISFIYFRGPMYFYNKIKKDDISIKNLRRLKIV